MKIKADSAQEKNNKIREVNAENEKKRLALERKYK
jgi:hypothetical protein